MPEAARVGDHHTCPCPTPQAHVGGPIEPPCSPDVETNGRPQARATDQLTCTGVGLRNFIVTGSPTVVINGKMAARRTDYTMHAPPGMIVAGSPDVVIGGGRAGATLGDPAAGQRACVAARAGRDPPAGALSPSGAQLQPNTDGQSYNNCGVESVRQIINQVDPANAQTQEELLNHAMANGNATSVPGNLHASGGTLPQQRVNILTDHGVGATQVAPTMDNLQQHVGLGRGVTADVWAARFWPADVVTGSGMVPGTNAGGHSILVTGVEFDAQGNLENVIVNDTGTGDCSRSVPAAQFEGALIGGGNNHVVTDDPIW
ncbi:MAG: PAAR domain-containing protein [Nannocystis sp.]|nr:PAAR domain-containing protein [Nannocystis sp.]